MKEFIGEEGSVEQEFLQMKGDDHQKLHRFQQILNVVYLYCTSSKTPDEIIEGLRRITFTNRKLLSFLKGKASLLIFTPMNLSLTKIEIQNIINSDSKEEGIK